MESIYNAVRHLERQSEPVRGKKKKKKTTFKWTYFDS